MAIRLPTIPPPGPRKRETALHDYSETRFATRAIHVGQTPDPLTGAAVPPLYLTSTYVQSSPGVHTGYEYSRTAHPSGDRFEETMASLEGTRYCLSFPSGLAAITTLMLTFKPGDHILCCDDVYGGTNRLLRHFVRDSMEFGLTFVDMTDLEATEAALQPKTVLIWMETPTNPTLKISDIGALAALAHKHKAPLVVDNTFLSPYFQQPKLFGADIIAHSVTKYLNGHSDVVLGVLCFDDTELYHRLFFLRNTVGTCPSPFDCWLASRGVKTLAVRMERHAANAMELATWLASDENADIVEKVIYPGLPTHPQYNLAKRQMSGFGGMITFYVRGTLRMARTVLEALNVFLLAESLGGVESLAEQPAIMTHASVSPEDRATLGIHDTLIRLSVGIEDVKDLKADLASALAKARKVAAEASADLTIPMT